MRSRAPGLLFIDTERTFSAPPPGAVVAEPTRAGGVNEFCSQYEWACILAGLAAFGATVAIIDGTSD